MATGISQLTTWRYGHLKTRENICQALATRQNTGSLSRPRQKSQSCLSKNSIRKLQTTCSQDVTPISTRRRTRKDSRDWRLFPPQYVQARPSHGDQSQDQSQTPGTRQRPLGAIKICCCRNLPAWTTHHRTFSHSHPIGPLWPITSHPHIAHLILKLSSANRTFSYRLCCILCRLSTLSTVT